MFAWNDFFDSGTPETIKQQTTRQTPSNARVYVLLCLFNRCTSTDYGGALSCSSSVEYLLLESSAFFSCTTTSDRGGGVYIYNSNCQSVLHKVCGYDCYSNSVGHFSYTRVKYTATSKNYYNYSSISHCRKESYGTEMLTICYGKICCLSVNSSNNKCSSHSGIYCVPHPDTSSAICSFVHSSFVDNHATSSICICLNGGSAKYEIKSCNILRNTQVSLSSQGTILTQGDLMIEDSCILENNANYIIYASSSYTLTFSNCTVDKTTTNTGILKIQNTVTESFILALNHMSTEHCSAEYDSAGNLTPIIEHPSSKKVICYCTYRNYFYQPHLSIFVSLMCVFMFNFIHIVPSCDL
jgi:hypothetical protein